MIEPLIDEVQLALLALKKTEKLPYVNNFDAPMTLALKRLIIGCSSSHLSTMAFCMRKSAFHWAIPVISSTF